MSKLAPLFRFTTYPTDRFRVLSGANTGDPIGMADDMAPGDIYRLDRDATPARLAICDDAAGGQVVADGSEIGLPGDRVEILDCHHFMRSSGEMTEALVLECVGELGASQHILPLAPIRDVVEYELIGSETAGAPARLADIASVNFVAGTHLTMANGSQRAVEDLAVGDVLLTRAHGPQPIRWIAQHTYRATGPAALVRISEGTLNTARDLWLSPQHRLFIWQRRDTLGAGRAEVMVRAELLVNGDTVQHQEGGHVDSYQLIFDGHEIIYAEGIAVESLLVTGMHRARLPEDLNLRSDPADGRADLEVDEATLGSPEDAAARLTRASRGHSD